MMSSKRLGAREEPAVLGEELATRPGRRRRSARGCSSLRSRTISRFAARSSGVIDRIASDMPCTNWSSTCALEPLDELVEALAGVGLQEVVLLQAADPLADVGRQRVELVEPLGGDVAQHPRAASGSAPRRPSPRRLRRAAARTPAALLADDLVELAPDVAEDVVEPVALEQLLAPPLEPVHQVAQAGAGRRGSGRPSRQPRSISRRSASARSPSAMTSSASASRISSASRSGDLLAAVPARSSAPAGRARRAASPRPAVAARGRADRA